jgi:hypothetical protein
MIPTNKEILERIEAIEQALLKLQRLIENEMNDVYEDGFQHGSYFGTNFTIEELDDYWDDDGGELVGI